jgi:hypothetical protein
MSLNLDWSACKDKTYAEPLGFYMMFTGLGWELTEKNAEEFYTRILFHHKMIGPIYRQDGEPIDWTPDKIVDAIGLRANVSPETWKQFTNRMLAAERHESARSLDSLYRINVHRLTQEAYDAINVPEISGPNAKWKVIDNVTFFAPSRDEEDGHIWYDGEVSIGFTFFPINPDGTTDLDGYYSINVANDQPSRISIYRKATTTA